MKLKSLRLQNIACFEDITLDFCHKQTGEPCQWVVLLGENGTGKTTLCQMAAATLISPRIPQHRRVPINTLNWGKYLRSSSDQGSVATGVVDEYDSPTVFVLHGTGVEFMMEQGRESDDTPFDFACGYGSPRRSFLPFPHVKEPDRGNLEYRFATLFGIESGLTDAQEWLARLYFRTVHEDATERDRVNFARATATLEKVLPELHFKDVTADQVVRFQEKASEQIVPLDRLSDGYRATTAWVMDLTRRLCDAFPEMANPLEAPGVVLVDEIDLHLHPKWQRTIVETIRKTFPNLQFIVTTHSPFVAQDMTENDKIIVLERNEQGVVTATDGMGIAQRWRVDQILSAYFGIENSRDGGAIEDEDQYQRLLEKNLSSKLTGSEKAQLRELKQRLDEDPLGETLDDAEIYAAANALAAALLKNDPD